MDLIDEDPERYIELEIFALLGKINVTNATYLCKET